MRSFRERFERSHPPACVRRGSSTPGGGGYAASSPHMSAQLAPGSRGQPRVVITARAGSPAGQQGIGTMLIRAGLVALTLAGLATTGLATSAQAQNNTAAGAVIGGATGALIGGAVTGRAGGAAVGAVLGGATGAILGAQSEQRAPQPSYFWGQDGRCYLQDPDGEVMRVSRSYCR